jgi:5'-3' exonuclease
MTQQLGTWVIVDVPSLAFRAWHAMENICYKGQNVGVLYGILRDIRMIQDLFDTSRIAFCFDQEPSLRKEFFPPYKSSRVRVGKEKLYRQIEELRDRTLPSIGFRNIFSHEGYEADDWMGFLVLETQRYSSSVLVTRDQDMRQLLSNKCDIYDPQTKCVYNLAEFRDEYRGLEPKQLINLKALMGCKSDDIPGVEGVGFENAVRIVKGETITPKLEIKLNQFRELEQFERNVQLVKLPWPGLDKIWDDKSLTMRKDCVTQEKWVKICSDCGAHSLIPKCPRVTE